MSDAQKAPREDRPGTPCAICGGTEYARGTVNGQWRHVSPEACMQQLKSDRDGWQRTAEINLDTVTAQHERLVKVEQLLRDALQVLEAAPPDDDDTSNPFMDGALPVVGYCSKCGDVRESFYTCRDGGHTIPKADQSSEQQGDTAHNPADDAPISRTAE